MQRLTENDFLISPDMHEVGTGDFHLMTQAKLYGEQATLPYLEKLRLLSISDADYQIYQNEKLVKRNKLIFHGDINLDSISIINDSAYSQKVIEARLGLKEGETVSTEELEKQIDRLYALGNFETIDYEVTTEQYADNPPTSNLQLDLEQKSWGPGFVDFRLAGEAASATETELVFGVAYTLKGLNDYGAEWRTEAELGTYQNFKTEFYTPIEPSLSLYWSVSADSENTTRNSYSVNVAAKATTANNVEYVALNAELWGARTVIGWNLNPSTSLEFGWRGRRGVVEAKGFNFESDVDFHGAFVEFNFDNLDSYTLPTEGGNFHFVSAYFKENWQDASLQDNAYWYGKYRQALSSGNNTLLLFTEAGANHADVLTPINSHLLGGFMRLSGFRRDELAGHFMGLVGAAYYFKVVENDFGIFKAPSYLGTSLERGNVWHSHSELEWGNAITAGSLFAATDTSYGPVILAWGINDIQHSVYLYIGHDI